MTGYLQRVFRVLPEEAGKLLGLAALAGLLQAGVAVGMTAADSLFLAHLGARQLPFVYLALPLVMLVYAPVYSVLLARLGIDRLIRWTLLLLVAGGVAFGSAVTVTDGPVPWLLYAMKLYTGLWFIALYTLFWNFADDFFSILDGKRLYGLIAAGGALGATLGATLVTALSHRIDPARMFYIWSALAAAAIPLVAALGRRHPRIAPDETANGSSSPREVLRSVGRTFRESRFALALAIACFCAVNLTAVLEYLAMGVFAAGKSPADLAELLGRLYAVANVLTVATSLFAYNRLVSRIGVRNTTLVLPVAFFAAFVALFLERGLAAALLAFYAYQTVLASIEYNNVNLLFNALPTPTKRPLRTFVEAMSEPAATALAGGLLWLFADRLGPTYVALAGLLAALGAIGVAFVLRHGYADALTGSLRRDWLDFSPPPEHWRQTLGESDRIRLRAIAHDSTDRAERIAAADLLVYTADPDAANALSRLVAEARPGEAGPLRPAIDRVLRSTDTATIANLLLWLESDTSPEDPELLDEFTAGGALPLRYLPRWRRSRHPARVAMTAVAGWFGPRVEDTEEALNGIRGLLAGDRASRRWAIRAIGMFRHAPHTRALLPFLDEHDAEIRLETLRALHRLASPEIDVVLPKILPLLADGTPEERQLILGIVEHVGSVSAVSELLLSAGHFAAAEARQLETVLVGLGPRAIATVIHVVRDPTVPVRARTIAARALGRLSRAQLELVADDLMLTELRGAQELSDRAADLDAISTAEATGIVVLRRFYRDAAREGVEFVLQLLGLTGRLPDVDLIQFSLSFASEKDRANAVETIEQSCPRTLFASLQPLLARRPGRIAKGAVLPPETLLRRASGSENATEAAAALLAAQEIGLANGRELLLRRVDRSESGRITAMLASLLPRFDASAEENASQPLHFAQRLAALVRAAYFADASIAGLEYLASRCHELRLAAGKTLYEPRLPSGDLIVVADGAIELRQAGGTVTLGPGGTCNERTLTGAAPRDESAVSQGSVVLAIPGATVLRAIEIFPALGMSLYKTKAVPSARA